MTGDGFLFQPEIELMDTAAKEQLQSQRLTDLVERLRASDTPYWNEKLAGIPTIRSIRDITELPLTEKHELRDTYPYAMLAMPLSETIRLHASSGTSGKPTVVGYSRGDIAVFAEVNARALAIAGVRPGDVLHNA